MRKNINWARVAAYFVYYIGGIILTFAVMIAMFAIPEFFLHLIGYGIY